MVDPSLLRQAADRGVTIAFADLDGADGLWVPEERTVLVSRALPESAISEVIEHELAHVAIDDQHAALDAGRDVLVGRRPRVATGPGAVAAAAVALVAVVGGVVYGVSQVTGPPREQVVGPVPDSTLIADEPAQPQPTTTVVVTRGPDGRVLTRTITVTGSAPVPRTSPTVGTPAPSPSPTAPAPRATPSRTAQRTAAPTESVPPTISPQPPPSSVSSPTEEPTTPVAPTTPVVEPGGGDGEEGEGPDTGDGIGGVEGPTEDAPGSTEAVTGSASAVLTPGT